MRRFYIDQGNVEILDAILPEPIKDSNHDLDSEAHQGDRSFLDG